MGHPPCPDGHIARTAGVDVIRLMGVEFMLLSVRFILEYTFLNRQAPAPDRPE
jgi:hypothetical protein